MRILLAGWLAGCVGIIDLPLAILLFRFRRVPRMLEQGCSLKFYVQLLLQRIKLNFV